MRLENLRGSSEYEPKELKVSDKCANGTDEKLELE
jgi:hypothetical protein